MDAALVETKPKNMFTNMMDNCGGITNQKVNLPGVVTDLTDLEDDGSSPVFQLVSNSLKPISPKFERGSKVSNVTSLINNVDCRERLIPGSDHNIEESDWDYQDMPIFKM